MSREIGIIVFAWLAFFGFWIACIFIYKAAEPRERDSRWSVFLISVVLTSIAAEFLTARYLLNRFDLPPSIDFLSGVMGAILLLIGLFLAIWARIVLGRFWSGSVAIIENQPIIKSGPYAVVRHPIYTGIIAMLWGSFLLERIGFILFIAVLGTAFLLLKARLEEAMLKRHKGEEYLHYRKQVKGMIL